MKDRVNKKRTENFTTTSNKILQDKRLSYEAIGLFVYLWSMPDDWQVMVKQVMKHNNSSEYSVRKALRELRDFGYMKWVRTQGYFIYDMCEDGSFYYSDIQHNEIHYSDIQHNDIYIQTNNSNKPITQTNTASGFSNKKEIPVSANFTHTQNYEDIIENFMQEKYPHLPEITKDSLRRFVGCMILEQQKKDKKELTRHEVIEIFAQIIKTLFPQIPTISILENVEPTVKESLTVEPTCKEYEQDFEEFYQAFQGVKTSKQPKMSSKVYPKWKNACKTHTNAEILHSVQKYAEYLQIATWRQKKDIIAWLNRAMYETDWEQEKLQEQQKSNQSTFNNQYAKPKPDHFSIDKKYAGTKNDDFFDGYINGK